MTDPTKNPNESVFGNKSNPAVSWKGLPFGTTMTMSVTDWPVQVQEQDFETKAPAYWEAGGKPKMAAVVSGTVNGEALTLWASIPSSLASALEAAQQAAGRDIGPGGTLVVTYTHDVPSTKGAHLNPAKQFTASYTAPSAFAGSVAQPVIAMQPAQVIAPTPAATPAPVASNGNGHGAPITAEQFAALAAAGVDMSNFSIAAV